MSKNTEQRPQPGTCPQGAAPPWFWAAIDSTWSHEEDLKHTPPLPSLFYFLEGLRWTLALDPLIQ